MKNKIKNKKVDRFYELISIRESFNKFVKDLDVGEIDDNVDSNEVTKRVVECLNEINLFLFKR